MDRPLGAKGAHSPRDEQPEHVEVQRTKDRRQYRGQSGKKNPVIFARLGPALREQVR
jgi:hypothetical protein